MPKRPDDGDYYISDRTQHVALGDVFRGVPLAVGGEGASFPEGDLATYGVLINYTSSMLVGAEGTNREYAHPYRALAPVFELEHLHEHDSKWSPEKIAQLREVDNFGGWMYLPAFPGEFEESGIALYRPTLVHQYDPVDLTNSRVTQLSFAASQVLCRKLAKVYAGLDVVLPDNHPNMDDHWEGVPA